MAEGSIARTRFIELISRRRPPKAIDSPSVVRPPPLTVTGTLYACAAFNTSETSSDEKGLTTPCGIPWASPPASERKTEVSERASWTPIALLLKCFTNEGHTSASHLEGFVW